MKTSHPILKPLLVLVASRSFIEGTPGHSGQPVRLVACSSGACQTGLAQNLANKLGVEVLAPTEAAYVRSGGPF